MKEIAAHLNASNEQPEYKAKTAMLSGEEFEVLLIKGEGKRIEFKEAQQSVPSSLYTSVTSFLNKEGGIVLLGITNDGIVKGLPDHKRLQYKQDIVTALNNPEIISPVYPLDVREVDFQGKQVLYIRVPVSSLVHKHAGIIYDRENDSDIKVNDDRLISDIYFRKRQTFTETQIFPGLKMEHLSQEVFNKVRKLIAAVNTTHPWLTASNERILRDVSFYRKDFSSGAEGLTLAAALVFGKDETIGNILPAYKFDVIVRRENTDRWDDRLPPLRTNLIDTYLLVLDFVKSKLPEKFFLEGTQRKDLRELIFRELVANMIIHREYQTAIASEIVIYSDRVEAKNPNKPRFTGPLDLDTFSAEPKNPNIRRFFSELNWADEIGSGVKNINKYLEYYIAGSKPSFIEDDIFLTTIPLISQRLDHFFIIVIHLARLSPYQLGDSKKAVLMTLPLNPVFANIPDLDHFAHKIVSTWAEKSRKLNQLRFMIFNNTQISDVKKAGTWEEKSKKLLKKRGNTILSTLLLALEPMTLEELTGILGYKNKERYREDYIKPLRICHLIRYTNPENPNDPNQAYVITKRGKDFLGGYNI
ncbi:MAG TPA: putative DNA binding domain-containing protein [Bacteroidales bacterium]|nr:putative DNA binding domain-containing protein [Bacteroidales bacterium]HSA43682.1 putative DNA binding domain-containing protein [Bacteroidales bacterium]